MKIGQKIILAKFFLDQLQLLDCEQCAKNEDLTIKNGSTIPCQVNREYIRKTQKGHIRA